MVIDVCTRAILVIETTKQIGFPAPEGSSFLGTSVHGEKDDEFPWNLEKPHVFFKTNYMDINMEDDMFHIVWNIYLHWDYLENYFRGQCRCAYSSTMDPLGMENDVGNHVFFSNSGWFFEILPLGLDEPTKSWG